MLNKFKNRREYGYIILTLLCLAIAIPSFAQYQVMALGDRIRTELGLSLSQFSGVATAPLIMGIIMGFVSGMLTDKFGLKVVTIAIAVTVAGVCLRAIADSYAVLYISMILLGSSATFVNTTTPKIMGSWFSGGNTTALIGITLASANISMSLGTGTAALFSSTKAVYVFTAIVSLIIMALWLLFFRERKTEGGQVPERVPFKESFIVVIKNKGVWGAALCAMATSIAITGCGVFMPQALMSRGMSEAGAGAMGMAITFGYMTTSLLSPVIIRRIGVTVRRLKVMMTVYGILMAAFVAFAWLAPIGPLIVIALFIEGFLVMGFQAFLLGVPVSMKAIGTRYSGTATGLIVTVQLLGAVIVTSYVAAPLAGDNFYVLNIIHAVCALSFCIFIRFLPLNELAKR
jgi:NNP family nitrate/nitrite transporter-like MFS transporter